MRLALNLMMITLALMVPALHADVLLIEDVREADQLNLPENGSTMQEVRTTFGDPVRTWPAVGDPPITRWEYDRWSVYFEGNLVLYSVLNKGAATRKASEPQN